MQATAKSHFARFAPRKVNQVLELVRNKPVSEAMKMLRFTPKQSAVLVAKTIKSAASNAGDRELKNPNLIVTSAWVGQGPILKRMRAYAMGRGSMYKRKTCHLTVIVSDEVKGNGRSR
jgi:large subunit ribosomal protein L22